MNAQNQNVIGINSAPNSNPGIEARLKIEEQLKGLFYVAAKPGFETHLKDYLQEHKGNIELIKLDEKTGLAAIFVNRTGIAELEKIDFLQKDENGSLLVHSKDGIPVINFEVSKRRMGLSESAPSQIAS